MKGIKKYTKSIDVTKQIAKEKLGKAANSADNDETKYTKERLHLIKWILKHTKAAGSDYLHHNESFSEKEQSLGSVLAAMGDSGTIDAAVGDAYGAVGATLKESGAAMKVVSIATNEHILDPLAKLYDGEAKQVLEFKKKQEVARLQLESAQTKLKENQKKGGKKLTEAEQEHQQAKTNYDNITKELDSQCNDLIRKMDERLLPQLQSFAAAQAAHYAKLAEQWRATQDVVTQLARMPYSSRSAAHTQGTHAAHDTQSPAKTQPSQAYTQQPVAESYPAGGNPFEQPQNIPQNVQQPPQQQQQFPHSPFSPQQPPNLPPHPSMQTFDPFNQPQPNTNNNTQKNAYPEEHDPFQQSLESQPDPFMQPQPKNVYSR